MFELTNHAKIRLIERNLPDPNNLRLCRVSTRFMKKLRKRLKSFNSETIYFSYNQKFIYVCIQIDINHYKVITAFEFFEN